MTNASHWQLYHVIFAKPIDKQLVLDVDLTALDGRKDATYETLHPLTKEGFVKGAPTELRDRLDATNKYTVAALLLNNDNVVSSIRRELRRVVDVLVDEQDILKVLRDEVVKRDTLEGPCAEQAAKRVNRTEKRALAVRKAAEEAKPPEPSAAAPSPPCAPTTT